MNIALLDDEMHENENLRAMIKVYAFERNYDTLNGMIVLTQTQIIKYINETAIGSTGGFSYDAAINKLFNFFSQNPEQPDNMTGVRLSFALKRFNEEFWATALHGFYPLVSEEWDKYGQDTKEFLFGWFIMCVRIVLTLWSNNEFASQNVADCKRLLNLIGFISERKVLEIEAAMEPFLLKKKSNDNGNMCTTIAH